MENGKKSHVRNVLGPFHELLRKVINEAWKRWRGLSAEDRLAFGHSRVMPNVMWAYIQDEARKHFDDTPIVSKEAEGTITYIVDNENGRVVFRFKKMDKRGYSQNFPTQRTMDFYRQLEMPGIPSGIRVDVGYVLNVLGTEINQIMVSYRDGNSVVWTDEIREPSAEVVAMEDYIEEQEVGAKGERKRVTSRSDQTEEKEERKGLSE